MSTDDEICEVIITGPNADWLANFTKSLVADGLAACGQNIATIRSIYRWQGAIEDEPEARVALHTRRALVDAPSSKGPDATIRTTCRASSRSAIWRKPGLHPVGTERDDAWRRALSADATLGPT